MNDARHLLRLLGFAAALCGAGAAQAGIRSERVLTEILRHTPAPMIVAQGRELAAAEKHAAALPGAQAFLGIGRSMEPVYAPNTAIVVQPLDFDALKKGMTVVYVSRRGNRVAHTVVGETRGGYILQGVNNDEEDEELLTEDNYLGVVVDAYASADTTFRTDLANRLAAKGRGVRAVASRG
ncbi:MAG TPA: S24/S26 family peptidase [Opitutaceae bacterium]|nr:S24/S26 family peptidase [Opitutaceae bacterium]